MSSLTLFPRLLVAQELDIASLAGEDWYGVYFNGKKAGYAREAVTIEDNGDVTITEDIRFRVRMVGVPQDMQVFSKRTYTPDRVLKRIDYKVVDPAGLKEFHATVEQDGLRLVSIVAGQTKEQRLPKPTESLRDVLQQASLVGQDARVGDEVTFSVFEPMYQKEIHGASRIAGIESRMFDGAQTRVFRVQTSLDTIGINSTAFVTESGTVLEDVVAGILTMRIEPEAMAKDVNYSNDVIVSNAALVDAPIDHPRDRARLDLRLDGPLSADHLFCDERQTITPEGDHFRFEGRRISLDGLDPPHVPIGEQALQEWVKPTLFVQADDPEIMAKAQEIVGDLTNALEVSNRLCDWVNDNVRTTFSAQLTNARDVLDQLEGDCTEYSVLFIALARAAGLPAREVAGLIYMEGVQPGFYFHQWAKVWVGKWIDVDPTFGQPLADVTHIKLAEGDLLQQARLIPVIGQLRIQVLEAEPSS